MSDESITHKEDTENLLYLARNLQLGDDAYGEDHAYMRESVNSVVSLPVSKDNLSESEIRLVESLEMKLGPSAFQDPRILARTKPFELVWSLGINYKVNIINLTIDGKNEVLYGACNVPVIYNYCDKTFTYFEGHPNTLTSLSADITGRWLVTCANKDGFVHVWDWHTCSETKKIAPVMSMFSLYGNYGTNLAKISPSAKYLITIGPVRDDLYSVDMWLWTLGNDVPEDSYIIQSLHGLPVQICYNPNIEEHIMIVFTKQIFLLVWDVKHAKFTSKIIPVLMHKNKVGYLTGGTYVDKCHECYASSAKGCISTFGNTLYSKPFEEGELDNVKLFINSIKISPASLDCITTTDGLVVTGDSRGEIYFFKKMEILYWFRDFKLGPIASISFNLSPKLKIQSLNKYYFTPSKPDSVFNCDFRDMVDELELLFQDKLPTDASRKHEPFIVRDFLVATGHADIYAVDIVKNTCTPLFEPAYGHITAIEVHHESNYLIICYSSNRIITMDYEKNEVISETTLPKIEEESSIISCIKYSHESFHLVCGKTNGEVWILEPILLKPMCSEPYQITKNKVMKIVFAHIPIQFAYYDENKTVCLFAYNYTSSEWEYRGRIRAHYEDITDILFIPVKPAKLCTIANDRHLVEYNNDKTDTEELQISSSDRIDQSAVPLCFIYWLATIGEKQLGYILMADDKHKLKFIYPQSKVMKSLFLGPAFGCFKNQLIRKMQILPHCESRYMVFCTKKHFGLQILPPDGNPYKYVGALAHPEMLQDFAISNDGKFIFTLGANDHCVFKWSIRTKSVETMRHIGGYELEPFYCLIEGGYHGWLFHEIKDLFYYMQILQQENIDLPRRVTDSIYITEIPDLFRTIGYYPSDFELENIMIDVKYRNLDETNRICDDITFIDFVKLYCNYKPVYGYSKQEMENAFNQLVGTYMSRSCYSFVYAGASGGNEGGDEVTVNREELIEALTSEGEPLSRSTIFKCFKTLMRVDDMDENFEFLPEDITFQAFFENILGIEMNRERVLESNSVDDDDDEISLIKA